MKKNLNVPFKNWKGEPVKMQAQDESGNMVMKDQLISDELGALFFQVTGSDTLQVSADEKLRLYRIACKIADNPSEVELVSEDIVLMKHILKKGCSAGAYGQIYDILEGD